MPRARSPRFYPIQSHRTYSLREAAEVLGVPEGRIRRAILLDDLPCTTADDHREYLLEGATLQAFVQTLRPGEPCRFDPEDSSLYWTLGMLLFIPLVFLIALFWLALEAPTALEAPPSAPGAVESSPTFRNPAYHRSNTPLRTPAVDRKSP